MTTEVNKMVDVNAVVASNIMSKMKEHNTKQIELANAIGVSKQVMSKMLNGARLISIAELQKIAAYYHIPTDELLCRPAETCNVNVVRAFMGKVNSDAAREALRTADELADLIIFHANVRDNARIMAEPWEM